jgi:hypothetical protein
MVPLQWSYNFTFISMGYRTSQFLSNRGGRVHNKQKSITYILQWTGNVWRYHGAQNFSILLSSPPSPSPSSSSSLQNRIKTCVCTPEFSRTDLSILRFVFLHCEFYEFRISQLFSLLWTSSQLRVSRWHPRFITQFSLPHKSTEGVVTL